jgi:hypothetical protein
VRTATQNEASFKQLLEIIGDIPITAVTKSVVRDYKQTLLSYPANRYKGKRKEKTLEQPLSSARQVCTPRYFTDLDVSGS